MTTETERPPDTPSTGAELRDRAIRHHQAGELEPARDLYRRYLARFPRDAAMWSNLGALFRSVKAHALAAGCQRRAIELDPDSPTVLNNAANALFDAGEVDDALLLRQRALAQEPGKAEHWSSLSKYLRALGRHPEAVAEADKGLAAHPDDVELHIQRAFALLSLGDYPAGFAEFEWRWQGDEISLPQFPFPRWAGEPLAGKTVLVTPEQGFGDTVLMARFLPMLASLGCTVVLACKPPLVRLFTGLPGVTRLAVSEDDMTGCDVWTPMMDLPRYLGTTLDTLPDPAQLAVPDDSMARAQAMTAPFADRLKIGVLWSGSVTYRANHKRSFSHDRFLQLANIPGVQLFSLYKGPLAEAFHADGTACLIVDAASSDRDFADSAALIRELDLVITMDSAIAHVGASLGAPVWNLLHSEAYWLYEPFADHTPWYPSMRLIRQQASGDWRTVFAQLEGDVREMAQKRARP